MEVTPDTLLTEYRKLLRIRGERNEFPLFRQPKSQRHYDQFSLLRSMVLSHQDALYELIFSGQITDARRLSELIRFGGHHGSVSKANNLQWVDFMARVRERKSELPEAIQSYLDWLLRVHGW